MDDSVVKHLMSHDLDILLWLVDADVSSVSAHDSDEAYTTVNVQFEDGTIGSLTASRVPQRKIRRFSITAHSCRIDVDSIDQTVEIYRQSLPEYIEQNRGVRYRHESIASRHLDGSCLLVLYKVRVRSRHIQFYQYISIDDSAAIESPSNGFYDDILVFPTTNEVK